MGKDYISEIRKEFPYIKPFEEEDEDIWYERGYKFLEEGKLEEAEKNFKKLLLAQPEHHDGYEGLAYTYYKSGAKEKALWFMEKAVEIAKTFLKDDSIDIEVIEEMEDNLRRMKEEKELSIWWEGNFKINFGVTDNRERE